MSTEDLNREQKRAMKRMGALNEQGNPTRTQPQARVKAHDEPRIGPVTYMREVNDEMKKYCARDRRHTNHKETR